MRIEIDQRSLEANPDTLWHVLAAANGLLNGVIALEQKTQDKIRDCLVFSEKTKESDDVPWRIKIRITFNFSEKKIALWEISDRFYCVLNEDTMSQLETETKKVAFCYITRILREPMLIGKPETV